MDPICMDDGEGFSAPLGAGTLVGGMVTKLEDVSGLSERGLLEIPAVPCLFSLAR